MVPTFKTIWAFMDVSKRWEKILPSTLDPERQVAGASDRFGFLTGALPVVLLNSGERQVDTIRQAHVLRRPT